MADEIRERVLELDGRELPYRLVRRRGRRQVTLQLEPRVGLSVLAPRRLPLREVDAVLEREQDWLRRRLAALRDWEAAHPPRRFVDGETLSLLGERWRLCVREERGRRRPTLRHDSRPDGPGEIILHMPAGLCDEPRREAARRCLESWYRRLAKRLLAARIERWQRAVGKKPHSVSIRDNRSRWGSCSDAGRLSFNWQIVMAPPAVLDYLVVHELCHLVHGDHSPAFWRLVGGILPGYKVPRAWLRREGETLYL